MRQLSYSLRWFQSLVPWPRSLDKQSPLGSPRKTLRAVALGCSGGNCVNRAPLLSVELAAENGLATSTGVATATAVDRIRPAAAVEEVISSATLNMVVSPESVDVV